MAEADRQIEDEISRVVSRIIADYLEVEVEQVHTCSSFVELHPDVDSLAMLEIQTLVEEHYGMSIELDAQNDTFPMCLKDLVALIMRIGPNGPAVGGAKTPGGAT
ncbi:MAG: hypothetical protein RJA99_3360 [Pseudomonadota bacterium]|jgi:acyl carrier protein